ncbi:hypothetical protein HX875_06675 [Pseudomonas yamanorum]|uniref:Uncharacterized protein n=1 Tax=Pseudomonas yamanorum TaxID=515393 RepID=A0A7Y8F9V3_9PSED|nr:hypothetical protein [Pseudomonas yamanorum]NWE39145.1 hypothetical protein [Pseudomonas yamanorum]NWE74984.1 hypothetical protein [Pseudomonas yamanorum]
MQLQNGYVNGYVVIIFKHYINPCGAGVKPESVTWASFFVRVGLGFGGCSVVRELAPAGVRSAPIRLTAVLQE